MMRFFSQQSLNLYLAVFVSPTGSLEVAVLLTVDPFGLRVMDFELSFEQILHSQFGVASSLIISCNENTQGQKKKQNMRTR